MDVAMASAAMFELEHGALPKRGITEESCRHWGIGQVEIWESKYLAVTHRTAQGEFSAYRLFGQQGIYAEYGEVTSLYGQWFWRDGGRRVVVCATELDAVAYSQCQHHEWPVVSLTTSLHDAPIGLKHELEWLEAFESVVLMFGSGEDAVTAALKCAPIFSPGKARIANLPLETPCEMVAAGREEELISSMWGAKVWRPDGVIMGEDVWERVIQPDDDSGVPYPWAGLQSLTRGLRPRELVTLCAGTGVGKSSVCRELACYLAREGHRVGYIALEESIKRTARGLMGIWLNKPLHLELGETPIETLREAYEETVAQMVLYDHFGSMDMQHLMSRMRYMVVSLGVRFLFLDHLSIIVSGMSQGDERRLIDNAMTALRSFVEETGVGLVLVSHLRRPEGIGHEEGGATHLSQLRGSQSIPQLSDTVIGFERNQQSEDTRDEMFIRVLKNRWTGETGPAGSLIYNHDTGRLQEGAPF